MQMFMLITACDSVVLYNFSMSTRVCTFDLQKILMWTVFYEDTCENEERALQIMITCAAFLEMVVAVFGLCLQICIAFDLILTISRPFTPKESRIPMFIGVSMLIAVM